MSYVDIDRIAESVTRLLSDAELTACVQDLLTWQDKGGLPGAELRALAGRLEGEAGIDLHSSLEKVEVTVMREAALRFVAYQTGLRANQQ